MVIDTDMKRELRQREIKQEEQQEQEEREKAKKNSNFVMMYRDHMPEIRWLTKKKRNSQRNS